MVPFCATGFWFHFFPLNPICFGNCNQYFFVYLFRIHSGQLYYQVYLKTKLRTEKIWHDLRHYVHFYSVNSVYRIADFRLNDVVHISNAIESNRILCSRSRMWQIISESGNCYMEIFIGIMYSDFFKGYSASQFYFLALAHYQFDLFVFNTNY